MADKDQFKSEAEKAKTGHKPALAEKECYRYQQMRSKRMAIFDQSWQVLAGYFIPQLSDINEEKTEGTSGWGDRVFDTTAIEAARTCATGHSNWATPMTEPWFQWRPPQNLNLDENDEGNIWCAKCTEIAQDAMARSNYYPASEEQYKSRCVFGTGHLHIESGKDNLLQCTSRKISTYCVAQNEAGIVDTVYAEFKLTARQAAQQFGEAALTPRIKKALLSTDQKDIDKEFAILHAIRPRPEIEREFGKVDGPNKPIASIYISLDEKLCISCGGYDEMPDSVTRFSPWGTGSVWGYSPAFETLPNVRQLNYVVRFQDAVWELKANPRILEPIGMVGDVDLRPGGRTAFDPNVDQAALPREWMTSSDTRGTEMGIEQKQRSVDRMFYVDVFRALAGIDREMTAYEVQERMGENLSQLSPLYAQLITEKTGPDLKRIFGILFRAGAFPPPPRSMYVPDATGRKLQLAMPEVGYTSRLALALKALQNQATVETMNRTVEFVTATGRTDVLDNFRLDTIFRDVALNRGMSAKYLRPLPDVLAIRQQQAEAQRQQSAMMATEQASKAAANFGKAPQPIQNAVSEQVVGPAA